MSLGIYLPQRRMFLNRLIKQWLRNGGIVDFAVAVTAVADQIDDDVAAESVAIFEGHATDPHHGVDIFGIHVKDWNVLAAGELSGKMGGVQFAGRGRKSNQVVDDDMHGSANAEPRQVGVVESLGKNALSRERAIAVNQERQKFLTSAFPARSCLARVRPTVTGSTASRWLGLETR